MARFFGTGCLISYENYDKIHRMRIQYCSDLHLEFDKNSRFLQTAPLRVSGDILILAGDIIPIHDEFFNNSFFDIISQQFKQIFWVPGNHEYFYRSISDYSSSFNIQVYRNVNIVNNICLTYEGIQFVFSTLWSKISAENEKMIEQNVADFDCITNNNRKLRVADVNRLHDESLVFINQSLSEKQRKTVVVTHHLPSALCNSAKHNNSPLNEVFCVDLTELIEESNASYWLYGHSHFNQKPLFVGNTVLLTNQLGYVHLNEHGSFKHDAYFSI